MPERVTCPCCGHRTLPDGPGDYEVCPVCSWEDDGAPPWTVDGPNALSLVEAQQRYLAPGSPRAHKRRKTRAPRPHEARDPDWQPLEITEELLSRVAAAYAEWEEQLEQRHPVQALGWVWRHRRTASLRTRLHQMATGSIHVAG